MTKIRTLSLFITAALLTPAVAHAQRIVFVVRHAERADAGMSIQETDPQLSAIGKARAEKLAKMLADAGITAVYATQFIRTQDTVKPLAAALHVPVTTMPAAATPGLVDKVRADHPNDVVLIAGHSNTVPDIIKAFGGPAVTIADAEYDNLFVIVPATKTMTRIRFQP